MIDVKEFYQVGSFASFANIETSGVLDPLSVWWGTPR